MNRSHVVLGESIEIGEGKIILEPEPEPLGTDFEMLEITGRNEFDITFKIKPKLP